MPEHKFSQQITFLHAENLETTQHFYTKLLGLSMVRDQGTCIIIKTVENAFLGFCEHIEPTSPGQRVILTLVTDDVEGCYQDLAAKGVDLQDPPKSNPHYKIFHFFLKDPNGYWIEIQRFDEPL